MTALDELLKDAVEWFPEDSQRTHDTSRIVHRLIAIVKRQHRALLNDVEFSEGGCGCSAEASNAVVDCERLARGDE